MYKKKRVNSNSRIISTDEDPSLRIESSAIINLRGVSTKLNKYIVFTMQTYKKLNNKQFNNEYGCVRWNKTKLIRKLFSHQVLNDIKL